MKILNRHYRKQFSAIEIACVRATKAVFPIMSNFGGNDIGVELRLPVAHITRKDRMKVAELAAEIEEEFDVYIGTVTRPACQKEEGVKEEA
jgi:hypothetical protein